MGSTRSAVAVLFLITTTLGAPGEPVMYLPPFEVRTLDMGMGSRMFPIASSTFMPASQRLISQPTMPQQQQMSFQKQPVSPQQSMFQQQPTMATHQQIMSSQQQPVMPTESMMPTQQPMMSSQQQQEQSTMAMQQQPSLMHTTVMTSPPREEKERPHHNFTLNEFVEVLNEISEHNEERPDSRAVEEKDERGGYSGPPPQPPYQQPYPPPPYSSYPRPYAPPRPNYSSYQPPPSPAPYTPPAPTPVSKTVPDLTGLIKPVTTKVASKVSGLIGLLLALFSGSASDDFELKGFKDIVINGIVKPLLIVKGGIKSLISKLAIPVIALLLINVEVLITVWWLWDECPKEVHSYSKPTYNYNSYPQPHPSY